MSFVVGERRFIPHAIAIQAIAVGAAKPITRPEGAYVTKSGRTILAATKE